jgi:hypothetical protein
LYYRLTISIPNFQKGGDTPNDFLIFEILTILF